MVEIKKKLVPELRFPEFSERWTEKKLGDVARFSKGKGISKNEIAENGEHLCIRYGELYTTYGVLIDNAISRTNSPINELVFSSGGEVIIPASGETALDIATASVVMQGDVAIGGDLNIIKSKFDGAFLAYYLNTKRKLEIAKLAQGNSVVHLYASQLSSLTIFEPKIEEQKKIAAFLSSVDDKLTHLRRKRELLESYKRGLMQQLFSQQIRFKQDDGSDFPDWDVKKANELFCNHSNKNHKSDLPILSATQDRGMVKREDVDIDIKSSKKSVSSYKVIDAGDFVISLRSFQGGIEYSYINGIASPAYTVLKPIKPINDDFYKNHFKTADFISRLSSTVIGIRDGKQISYDAFSTLNIPYPDVEEQKKISDCLKAFDKKIDAVAEQITQLDTFKKGLLQKMFV